jgi:hypothetical protein
MYGFQENTIYFTCPHHIGEENLNNLVFRDRGYETFFSSYLINGPYKRFAGKARSLSNSLPTERCFTQKGNLVGIHNTSFSS